MNNHRYDNDNEKTEFETMSQGLIKINYSSKIEFAR